MATPLISVMPAMEWHPRDPNGVAQEEAMVEGLRKAQIGMLGDVAREQWRRHGATVTRRADLLEGKDGSLYTPREALYNDIMANRAKRQVAPAVERPGWENMVNRGHYTYPILEPVKQTWDGLVQVSDRASSLPEGVLEGLTDWASEGVPPISGIEKGIAGVFDPRYRPDRNKIYAGLTPVNRFIAENAMDPTNWVGVGALKGGTGAFVKAADNAMANAGGRMATAIDTMRYGKGVRADLVDEYGDMIRRLRNAPSKEPLRLEYAP